MNIFDTHSDTPFDLFRDKLDLDNDITNVSLSKTEKYEKKFFLSAFWSDKTKNDAECWEIFLESSPYYDSLLEKHSDKAMLCKNANDMKNCSESGKFGAIKAIEDVRLIDGHLERIEMLYNMGIRQMIPVWGGESHIGGAWDTEKGLTDFGKQVIVECEKIGIIIDVSHLSEKSFWDVAENTDMPFTASHSDFYDVNPHKRNLRREQFAQIVKRGGLTGINICQFHVNTKYNGNTVTENDDFLSDICKHIYYGLENGGEKTLCLGCDWDGTKMTPHIKDVSDIYKLYERLVKDGISEKTAEDIFFNNAYNFYINNLK